MELGVVCFTRERFWQKQKLKNWRHIWFKKMSCLETVLVRWGKPGLLFWASSNMTSRLWIKHSEFQTPLYGCIEIPAIRVSLSHPCTERCLFACRGKCSLFSATSSTRTICRCSHTKTAEALMLIFCSTIFAFQWLHSLIKNVVFGKQNLGHQNFLKTCRGAKQIRGKHLL